MTRHLLHDMVSKQSAAQPSSTASAFHEISQKVESGSCSLRAVKS